MDRTDEFMDDMLGLTDDGLGRLWRAGKVLAVQTDGVDALVRIVFIGQKPGAMTGEDSAVAKRSYSMRVRALGQYVLNCSIEFGGANELQDSEMLEFAKSMEPMALKVLEVKDGWEIRDEKDNIRMTLSNELPIVEYHSDLIEAPAEIFQATVFPDGETPVPFMSYDQFFPQKHDSLALAFIENDNDVCDSVFSLHAKNNECFAGTGERFYKMDLAGGTFELNNTDALGVNSSRVYKNVPFYVSSSGYGLFLNSSAHMKLSLGGISTRAAQCRIQEDRLDMFFIGGSVEKILEQYRCLTGFPGEVPDWSYGTWMSRMTYDSAEQVEAIGQRLRQEDYPCDVIHIDTGWFKEELICDWEFSQERFAEVEKFMARMKDVGYRISLWQTPNVSKKSKWYEFGCEKGYLVQSESSANSAGSDFTAKFAAALLDFSNEKAVKWYQGLLGDVLEKGASVIKTDFGENIDMDAKYATMDSDKLHNIYPLLYQRAAYEIVKEKTDEPLIWARAGWAGCQRYPVHWAGDAASSWDGLAGVLRGGLHLGLSGFGFWSHDVPGFHGVPDFMNSKIDEELYVRWTQFAVFSSHMRYHGTSPREPWEFPAVSDIVRKWWKLRYSLIPYLIEQGKKTCRTGYPVLRALIFHHEDDPTCWHIDDQYYLGDSLMAAPVMNAEGVRDVYLPEGEWLDFWTGENYAGQQWLRKVQSPLERIPVFLRKGSALPLYPVFVNCVDEMDFDKSVIVRLDDTYKGIQGHLEFEV